MCCFLVAIRRSKTPPQPPGLTGYDASTVAFMLALLDAYEEAAEWTELARTVAPKPTRTGTGYSNSSGSECAG